ncbi:MAG: ABC transporter ATP-binding protein [Desulfosporosinus sp.]|nr:ABC transporter ATP-binding protein [Desulfosporosinus sp.]
MAAYVRLEGISKRYGNVVAVDDVSLDITEHEFITLLGPSGSGKTTILMIVAGFIKADSGLVFIDGKDVTETPPYLRNIGVVFQNYALFPHMTVYDNITYPLKMRRIPRVKASKMFEEILNAVQLRGLEGRRPAQLSGGQQQRVALARALVFRPPLLLMDEPLSALDRKLREHMQLELKHIQKQLEISILYVTHDQEEALTMSSRIAIMKNGRIEQMGSPLDIYDHPATPFIADFVGETNLYQAKVVQIDDDAAIISSSSIGCVRVKTTNQFKIGSRVRLAVRPEKVYFHNGQNLGFCTYNGLVEDIIYLGDTTKYYIRVSNTSQNGDNGVVVMKVLNRQETEKYNMGDRVKIGWNAMDATIV